MKKILIVGAGFAGAVIARELAEADLKVTVIDQRDHIGGNAFDFINSSGHRVHLYGPHIFHTSNERVVKWVSRFTQWNNYRHKVKAILSNNKLVTLPINLETSAIIGENNLIDVLYRPYTKKMWGVDLEMLNPEIIQRLPIRNDLNEDYFPNDTFQAMPQDGYTSLFKNILDHGNIEINLSTKFKKHEESRYSHVFNSMAIDEYFDFEHGALPYRSIKFHTMEIPIPRVLNIATMNFTHHGKFTRVTEWKHFPNHGNNLESTTITLEEPCDYADNNYERFYPVKDLAGVNADLYKRYLTQVGDNMTFIGRCGRYAYLDMHQAISLSLRVAHEFLQKHV